MRNPIPKSDLFVTPKSLDEVVAFINAMPAKEQAQAMTANNGLFFNTNTIAVNTTVASNYNGGSFGPVTINAGITVTVSSGSVWTIV